jgi:sRNA-binding protein
VPISEVKNRIFKNGKKLTLKEQVLSDINELLPAQPYKIGINKDLFDALKSKPQYFGKRSKLRRLIKYHLRHKCKGRHYLKAMLNKKCRNGIDGGRQGIKDEHRKYAKIKLEAVLKSRKKRLDKKLKRKT